MFSKDLKAFILSEPKTQVLDLLKHEETKKFYFFNLNIQRWLSLYPEYTPVMCDVNQFVNGVKKVVISVQYEYLKELQNDVALTIKKHLFIRLKNCPFFKTLELNNGRIDESLVGGLGILKGRIVKIRGGKVREKIQVYKCATCRHETVAEFDWCEIHNIVKALKCREETQEGNKSRFANFVDKNKKKSVTYCNSTRFEKMENESVYVDDNEFKFLIENSSTGNNQFITVCYEGDYSDIIKPGFRCALFGSIEVKFNNFNQGKRGSNFLVFNMLGVERLSHNYQPFQFDYSVLNEVKKDPYSELYYRNFLLESVCKDVKGNYHIKLALLMFSIINADITKTSDTLNLLISGDPKTGKTHILKSFKKCFASEFLVNCNSLNDSANITIDVVTEQNTTFIEAGILSMVNYNYIILDDLNFMSEKNVSKLVTCVKERKFLEKKFGVSIDSRVAMLATCSPNIFNKKLYSKLTYEEKIGLPRSILNQFELVFKLHHDEEHDIQIIDQFISTKCKKGYREINDDKEILFIRKFVEDVQNTKPVLDDNCKQLLLLYIRYLDMNKHVIKPTNILDTLVLLTKTHAKLFMRTNCSHIDSVSAIMLYESSNPSGLTFIDDNSFYVEDEDAYQENYDSFITFLFSLSV